MAMAECVYALKQPLATCEVYAMLTPDTCVFTAMFDVDVMYIMGSATSNFLGNR